MFKVFILSVIIASAVAQQNVRVLNSGQNIQGLQELLNSLNLQGLNGGGSGGQIVLLLNGAQQQQQNARVVSLAPQPAPAPVTLRRITTTSSAASSASVNDEPEGPPRPYDFEYSATDEQGTTSTRKESSDGRTVTGSYSYVDPDGLTRVVDYTADENGFRANVRTNEPGTATNPEVGDPADTQWEVSDPPQAVLDRYANVQAVRTDVRTNVQVQPQPQPRIAVIRAQPQPQPRIVVQQQAPRQQQFVLVPADQLSGLTGGNLGGIRLATAATTAQQNNPGIILLNGLRRK